MLKTSSLCNVRVMSLPRRSAVRAFHAATCKGNRSGTCAELAVRRLLIEGNAATLESGSIPRQRSVAQALAVAVLRQFCFAGPCRRRGIGQTRLAGGGAEGGGGVYTV